MTEKRKTFIARAAACFLCLAVLVSVCGCGETAESSGVPDVQTAAPVEAAGTLAQEGNDAYQDFDGEPYVVRTVLREYTAADPEKGTGAYGRYTELKVEGSAPDTFRDAVDACNRRAEESVRARVDQAMAEKPASGSRGDGYRFVTYGYIANVTRADQTAFSILETEFEKMDGAADSETAYRFRGTTWDTKSGGEIALSDLAGDEAACSGMLREALSSKYGVDGLAETGPSDYAWTADALGIRFYFNSDAVSAEKRTEIGDYTARAVTAAFSYDALTGGKAQALSAVPDSYIAMIERETVYDLPHGDLSVLLTETEDSVVIRIRKDGGEPEELSIEYADDISDFYIIRAQGGFYLFRERVGYEEGFFYDFSRPDGGFGRFAYNPSQYFDSFLREIKLAVPYNPYCVHMAEVRRSFGEKIYDECSFIPHGHYMFPSDPDARYKHFVLTDSSLQIDSCNTACRLLEDFSAVKIDPEGKELGEITVPAGARMVFEAVTGEAPRYDDPPNRNQSRTYLYDCRLTDGTRIRFASTTESTVSAEKGFLNRFTEPISLWEALAEELPDTVQQEEPFTVRIGGKDYPVIPDYSLTDHTGEEIDFGDDIWWQVEGYPGRYVSTDEDMEEMEDELYAQEALAHPGERAELVISEDGEVVFDWFGEIYRGSLPEKRYYRTRVHVFMESETHRRSFSIILRSGEEHDTPGKIEFYSEGEPATNEPSNVPPLTVYMTRIRD